MQTLTIILTSVASVAKKAAVASAHTASLCGMYQPALPKKLQDKASSSP